MADVSQKLLNKPTYSAAGTNNSTAFKTNGYIDITFILACEAPGGVAGDTLDVVIEESDEQDFSDAERVREVLSFTQIIGTHTAASDLKQRKDLPTKNIDTWVRAKVTTASDHTKYNGKFFVSMLATEKV